MNLLIDTNAFLWFAWDDPRLSVTARAYIEDPANRIWVSIASCWEIAIKAGTGKLKLGAPAEVFIPRELSRNSLELLDITLAHAVAVETLPLHHRDPFDRMLVVQASIEALTLVSIDTAFDPYGTSRIW